MSPKVVVTKACAVGLCSEQGGTQAGGSTDRGETGKQGCGTPEDTFAYLSTSSLSMGRL